jgi:hypothetical protein
MDGATRRERDLRSRHEPSGMAVPSTATVKRPSISMRVWPLTQSSMGRVGPQVNR